jgi:hypothetical protein
MTHLFDSNVLIALAIGDHVHHQSAVRWWATENESFATCPITQGALVRTLIREGRNSAEAHQVLSMFTDHKRHAFWSDDIGFDTHDLSHVHGHRQVTDTYLAALARRQRARLATFDRGIAAYARDVVTLIPLE